MCGICGIWNYETKIGVDRDLLRRMADTMAHRGPDDRGLHFDDAHGLGLGFRRLSIIDLSPAGRQPMSNEDGTVWLVFNGEIYNFLDLRPELEGRGHVFRSRTDSEVIIHLYEDRGLQFVHHLNGMFGLAIWDARRHRIVLARDRMGQKPLYYYDDGQRLIFGSELKAILADRSVPRQLDYTALCQYLSLGYVPSPCTILQGIKKLPPAHMTVFEKKRETSSRYWDWLPAFQPDNMLSEAAWIERLRQTLREAVRIRLVSDVPLGAFLSGGVDSSAVVATMAELSNCPVKTFSIGFEEEPHSELKHARQVARRFGTDHHEYLVKPEAISEVLPRLAQQLDEPFGDSSALPTYYVSQMSRQEVTVCLSGDGGDEALAGYGRYGRAIGELWLDRIPHRLREAVLSFPTAVTSPYTLAHRLATRFMLKPDSRYVLRMQTFYAAQARQLLQPDVASCVDDLPAFLEAFQRGARQLDYLSRVQYVDAMTYLPEDILVKVDRMSMLNSLEVRSPMLDYRFLELAAAIPPGLRRKNGDGKYILKQAMRGLVPDAVMDRPKKGFSIPAQQWLQGDAADFVRDVLLSRRLVERGLFRSEVIEGLLSQSSAFAKVWALLIFELWCQAYLDHDDPAA